MKVFIHIRNENLYSIFSRLILNVVESETPTPEGVAIKAFGSEPVKPHEQRALNFLINEYLLLHGYKLTSITFADENENQVIYESNRIITKMPKTLKLNVYPFCASGL